VSLSGPYHSVEAIAAQMRNNFGTESQQGKETVDELLENGQLGHMLHVTSPINNDQNRTKTCRIIKGTNAEVKARLPGPAYYVASSEIDAHDIHTQPADGTMPCSDMTLHGTFLDEESATATARQVATGIASSLQNAQMSELDGMNQQPGLVKQFVIYQGLTNEDGLKVVLVRYDRGE
jgi:hypothetical protein